MSDQSATPTNPGTTALQPKPPFKPLPLCRYIMPNGRRCQGIRLKNHPHACYFHAPLCVRRGRGKPSPLPFSRLQGTSRELLQASADQLTRKLATNRAQSQRDRVILYGLQLALQAMDKD